MKMMDRLREGDASFLRDGPVNLAFFGDSITQGCFEDGVCDFDAVYHAQLKRMLHEKYPGFPINILNAGVGGSTAKQSLNRLERDVLRHHPDAAVVCFGLNDVTGTLEDYVSSLASIFRTLQEHQTDTVFMTPNMLNTRMDEAFLAASPFREYALGTMKLQTGGTMDAFMSAACECARSFGIPVCDCYAEWKSMAAAGKDTTALLANRINHPSREMHTLFAGKLLTVLENS